MSRKKIEAENILSTLTNEERQLNELLKISKHAKSVADNVSIITFIICIQFLIAIGIFLFKWKVMTDLFSAF